MSDTTADESPAAGAISDAGDTHQPAPADNLSEKMEKMNISSPSFSIWPPTQRTRDAVINRLIETLSTPSVLSKRYGSIPLDEASSTAKAIEEEAFTFASAASASSHASASASSSSIDEGIEILQVYSKEISKRMLDAVKSRAVIPPTDVSVAPESDRATVATSEDVSSSVDNESSS